MQLLSSNLRGELQAVQVVATPAQLRQAAEQFSQALTVDEGT
jgi:hypothetical protein